MHEWELQDAINNRMLFESVPEKRLRVDGLYVPGCPFCGASYLKGEYRPRVASCPVCAGYAFRAAEAELEVERVFHDLADMSLTEIRTYIMTLAPGYWRAEYRGVWRRKHEKQNKE